MQKVTARASVFIVRKHAHNTKTLQQTQAKAMFTFFVDAASVGFTL